MCQHAHVQRPPRFQKTHLCLCQEVRWVGVGVQPPSKGAVITHTGRPLVLLQLLRGEHMLLLLLLLWRLLRQRCRQGMLLLLLANSPA